MAESVNVRRELNARHWKALRALHRAGASGLSTLDLRLAIGAYATNTIASLEARGLVIRRTKFHGANGSNVIYQLTDAGRALGDRPHPEG